MPELSPRREALLLSIALLLALTLRAGFAAWTSPVPPPLSDAEYYDAAARSLARGDGYSVLLEDAAFRPGGEATAFFPPGYSLYLGAGYSVLGESLGVARALNVLAGALTTLPVWWLARRYFAPAAAVVSAFLVALSPSLVAWAPVLLSDTLFTFLFALALAVLAPALGRERRALPWQLGLAGVAIGFASLVRGQALVILPAALALMLWQRLSWQEAARRLALLGAGAALVLAPWALRSTLAMDTPVLLSTNFGYNLRVGHATYATGRYVTPEDLWVDPAGDLHARETVFNEAGRDRALDYALSHPLREAALSARKVLALWQPDTDVVTWVESYGLTPLPAGAPAVLKAVLVAGYLALLALAACGALRGPAPYRRLAILLVLLWTLAHIVFFGEPRYHLPLLALFAAPAGHALVLLWRRTGRLDQALRPMIQE